MVQKGSALVIVILILAAVIATGAGAWYYLSKKNSTQILDVLAEPNTRATTQPPTQQLETPRQLSQDIYANWRAYRNKKYGFEFNYPNNWKLVSEEQDTSKTNTWAVIIKSEDE